MYFLQLLIRENIGHACIFIVHDGIWVFSAFSKILVGSAGDNRKRAEYCFESTVSEKRTH